MRINRGGIGSIYVLIKMLLLFYTLLVHHGLKISKSQYKHHAINKIEDTVLNYMAP